MANTKAFKVKNGLELQEYAKSINDTAVDVFVYDTSKDSDGGAWRHRTQSTSWYNETLNTATRGSRKEFPAVAVIVAESNQVTIYDGDDPDLPMWMVFNQGSGQHLGSTSLTLTALVAINGGVYVTYKSGSYGHHQLNFLKDASFFHNSSGLSVRSLPILNRNEQNTSSLINTNGVINAAHNDVAMTVLPNAPIDAATGLPVPTIAVATEGGVSVIRDDGTVVDSSTTANYQRIGFLSDYKLIGSEISGGFSTTIFDDYNSDGFAVLKTYNTSSQPYVSFAPSLSLPTGNNFAAYRAGNYGFANVSRQPENEDNGMVSAITSDYNTGWMNGDIKLATLSDTDATNVTGSELVNQDGTEWSLPTGWAHDGSGTLSYDGTGVQYSKANDNLTCVVGETYTFSMDVSACSGSFSLWFNNNTSSATGAYGRVDFTSQTGIITSTFVAESTTVTFTLQNNGALNSITTDSLTCRLAEEDRSVNGNGLQVFGTVTKSAVATGADLVGYTDFADNTNYFYQPPNADTDFGTGDFSVMLWHYHEDATLTDTIYFASGRSSEYSWQVGAAGSDSSYLWIIGGVINARSAANSVVEQAWTHLTYVRRNGATEIWVNGVLIETDTDTTDLNSNLGIEMPLSSAAGDGNDWMSLLRISATAPSPEQIKKIYEDEKFLFQDGAQATLYGSSDAVTALAYDDSTELLHVGTSAGRSVFQGLRRVDNTTDAVGTTISASNSMIAED